MLKNKQVENIMTNNKNWTYVSGSGISCEIEAKSAGSGRCVHRLGDFDFPLTTNFSALDQRCKILLSMVSRPLRRIRTTWYQIAREVLFLPEAEIGIENFGSNGEKPHRS